MKVLKWFLALPFVTASLARADSNETPSEITAEWDGGELHLTAGGRDAWVSLTFRLKHGAHLDTAWTQETVFVAAQQSIVITPSLPTVQLPVGVGAWPGTVTGYMIAQDGEGNWLQTAQPLPRALFTTTPSGVVTVSSDSLESLLPHPLVIGEGEVLATVSTSTGVSQ